MIYNTEIVKQQINLYFSGNISKEQLSVWARSAYSDCLRGGFLYLERLYTYFFLKKLSIFDVVPNDVKDEYPPSLQEIHEILDILSGTVNKVYKITIQINRVNPYAQKAKLFSFEKEEQYLHLQTIMHNLYSKKLLSDADRSQIKKFQMSRILIPTTLLELIELYILSLVSKPDADIFGFPHSNENGLHLKDSNNIGDLYLKISQFLDYYLGNKPFRACISFLAGQPSVIIV